MRWTDGGPRWAQLTKFDAVRRFIDRLQARQVLVLAGNHDIPLFDLRQCFWMPYARLRRTFGDVQKPRIDALGPRAARCGLSIGRTLLIESAKARRARRVLSYAARATRPTSGDGQSF
jgi:hypothetical protein